MRLALLLAVVTACSDPAKGSSLDAGAPDAPASPDAAPSPDAATAQCADLAASFGSGTATWLGDRWDVSACTATNATQFEIVKPAVRDPRWETARCNDGTPFAALVRLNPASSLWVIHFEGGGFCDDLAVQCSQRRIDDIDLTTTPAVADRTLVAGPDRGILSDDPMANPDLAAANHVFANYCSSDFWAGATTERRPTTGDAANGWYFSGHANATALVEILRDRFGLDDASADVLISGSSAGAIGASFNARLVADALPGAQGRTKLFLDAGWMFDWDEPSYRIINTTMPDREVWRRARDFWGATLDSACEAATPDPIDCWFGPTWYPHLTALMPVFLQLSRRDSVIGGWLHGPSLDYALWQTAAEASLVDVEWLWSGAFEYHVLSGSDPGWHFGTSPDKLVEAVGRFWRGEPPERILF